MMEVNILSFCYLTQLTTNIYTQVMGREGGGWSEGTPFDSKLRKKT